MNIEYIGEFEEIDDHRSGKLVIHLNGRLNKCGVISPRFNIKIDEIEKWVNNLLPSRQFGYLGKNYNNISFFIKNILFVLILICLVLTTSAGIMDHHEARRKHTGGKIIGM